MSNLSGSDVQTTHHFRIYRVQWCTDGFCYVSSNVNGSVVGVFTNVHNVDARWEWSDDAALPEDVREFAMSVKPQQTQNGETP